MNASFIKSDEEQIQERFMVAVEWMVTGILDKWPNEEKYKH